MTKPIDAIHKSQLEAALKTPDPFTALLQVARSMNDTGTSQLEMCAIFSELLEAMQGNATEQQDDAIRDVLDFIVGWCSPHQKLFDTYLQV